ncbi:HAD family hydrolase [Oscillatoriales cyanobacterium LEGE 11467]|uniref:HAD family hydrolase n=1 Tax=Zarconia navalis LEGE 11467 TaxID=1828826 RepID=A0A928VYU2_9CYAN|nr:HAD family hydrolase [Zarconia navalis]MBE9042621.1 HAD family hydrolase [Zarconia navalis LEGE 11467]
MSCFQKLLILDLDETLIFSTEIPLEYPECFKVPNYYVYLRPNFKYFIEYCFDNFEVAVWTASSRDYADEIIDRIFPDRHKLVFLWSNDRCTLKFHWQTGDYEFIKDLKKVKKRGYPLEKILFVDDRPENLIRQYSNLNSS